jgi:hypothetical protein
MGFLNLKESLLGIETGVHSKSAGNDQKSISEGLNTKLHFARDLFTGILVEVLRASDFEGTATGEDGFIFDSVLNGTETIADSVTSLGNRVIVGALDEDGAGEGVLDTLDKGVLIFT